MGTLENLSGCRFGRWLVTDTHERRNKRTYWECVCDCGQTRFVLAQNLKNGESVSCGCFNRELASKRLIEHNSKGYDTKERLYNIWKLIKARTLNKNSPAFNYYGGRGIRICDEWKTYKPFMEWAKANGYKDDLTIDRIDVNGDYCPENCRWATPKQQSNNKRNNRVLEYQGEKLTLAELSEKTGISYCTLKYRANHGLPLTNDTYQAEVYGYKGEQMTMYGISKKTGLSYSAIRYRIKKGIDLDAPRDEAYVRNIKRSGEK